LSAKAEARPRRDEDPGVDDAVKALRKFAKAFSVPRKRGSEVDAAREAAAALGLRGPASEGMLEWALDAAPRLAGGLRYVINQEQYDKLCKRISRELLRDWRERRGGKLGFGLAARAVDLVMMALGESESCRRESAAPFLRAPLDARTLARLRLIVDELSDVDFAVEIPAKPGAGFVTTEELYYILQSAVAELARRAETTPIVYAYWCAAG
jgi:hypothetical protein